MQTEPSAFVELSLPKSSKLNRYSEEEKNRHCEEWKKSGLSMNQYCRHSGISVTSLSTWANEAKLSASPTPRTHTDRPNSFSSVMEIVLPSGLKLRLAQTSTTDIVRLIKALESCN
jgi:transposase-like protein